MPTATVLATMGKKKPTEMYLFRDKTVKKNYYSNSGIAPWSPYTGRTGERVNTEKKVLSSETLKNKIVKLCDCRTCHSHIFINRFAASEVELQKKLFCPVCAADLHSQLPVPNSDNTTMVPESEEDALNSDEFPEIGGENEEHELPDDDLRGSSTMGGDDEASQGDMLDVVRRPSYTPMASKKDKKREQKKLEKKLAKRAKIRAEKKLAKKQAKKKKDEPTRDDVGTMQNKEPTQIDRPGPVDQTYQAVTGEPVAATVKKNSILFNFANVDLSKANLTLVPVASDRAYLIADKKPVMVLRASKATDEPFLKAVLTRKTLVQNQLP
jgi:hypothetical protein